MKKLILLLLFIPLVFSCSDVNDDDGVSLTIVNKDAITLKTSVKIFDEFGNAVTSSNSILNPSLDFEIYGRSTIEVLPKSNVVLVDGNVYNPGAFAFDSKSLRSYINSAGGMKKDTLRNKVYVQRANGKIKKVGFFKGMGISVRPGDKIVVPSNPNPRDFNFTQFIADFSSTLANIAAIIVIVDNTN